MPTPEQIAGACLIGLFVLAIGVALFLPGNWNDRSGDG